KVVVLDTPDNLKARLQGDVVSLTVKDQSAVEKLRPLLEKMSWVNKINVVASGNNYAAMSRMINMPMNHSGSHSHGMGHADAQAPPVPDSNGKDLELNGEKCPKCLNLLLDSGGHRIPEIVKIAENAGVVLDSVEMRKPTLDDVFLSVTGRNIRDEEGSFKDMVRSFRIMKQRRTQH
ncbi:MAG: hypothetical protein NWF04_10810, partial [Candidatus Bathyarchaeota archaeon]|nr:hypothetical protein [Candidatus Bathyarchaeota archaeon]